MMGKKKLAEIRAEVVALLNRLPGPSPRAWLQKEIDAAAEDPNRDVKALEMLCAALERETPRRKKAKAPRTAPSRAGGAKKRPA